MVRQIVATALASATLITAVHAECFFITAQYVMSAPSIELAFLGRVVNRVQVNERVSRVTFEVSRVWKGSVARRVDLYVWDLDAEAPRFPARAESVVLARKFDDAALRRAAGLSDSPALTEFQAMSCTDVHEPDLAKELGPGRVPTRR